MRYLLTECKGLVEGLEYPSGRRMRIRGGVKELRPARFAKKGRLAQLLQGQMVKPALSGRRVPPHLRRMIMAAQRLETAVLGLFQRAERTGDERLFMQAQAADARYAAMVDQIQAAMDELPVSGADPWTGAEEEMETELTPATVERKLAALYYRWSRGLHYYGITIDTKKDLIKHLRAVVDQSQGALGKPRRKITDSELFQAAEDAFERKVHLHYRSRTGGRMNPQMQKLLKKMRKRK